MLKWDRVKLVVEVLFIASALGTFFLYCAFINSERQNSVLFWDNIFQRINVTTALNNNNNSGAPAVNREAFCGDENMVYSVVLNEAGTVAHGKKFSCAHSWLLDRFKLSDKHTITKNTPVKRPGDPRFVFVTATNEKYFPFFRKFIVSLKQMFGCKIKVIAYDLGTVTQNKQMMTEVLSVCNLEWRTFDFSQMEQNVRSPQVFAWKVFVVAQTFLDFDTFMWCDTSVEFHTANWDAFLDRMQSGAIGHFQQPSSAWHGMKWATNPLMFDYLPSFTNFVAAEHDPFQYEANFLLLHRSEQTRKLLKWALLCAAERDCIEPKGSRIACSASEESLRKTKAQQTTEAVCNRQDQSVFAILVKNAEREAKMRDPGFVAQTEKAHPRSDGINRFEIVRRAKLDPKIDFAKAVACC